MMILFVMGAKSTFSQMLSPFAISSSGGYYIHPSGTFSTTIGEMSMVETFHATMFLTQGFQQPVPDNIVAVEELGNSQAEIAIFPNPATSQISVSIGTLKNNLYRIRIIDIVGKEMLTSIYSPATDDVSYTLNVSHFAKGVYLITIESADKIFNKTTSFIKN